MKNRKIKLFMAALLMTFITPMTTLAASDPCAKTPTQQAVQKCVTQTPAVHDIQLIVDWLSAGVGIVVTAVIIIGGIQYSLAGDNASAVTAAKERMINGVIALFVFLFAWAFLNWLIPGGVFK